MTDLTAHARVILDYNPYVVLGTADDAGNPWTTPVWFAPEGLTRFYWASWPGARHSELIAARPRIALTVFDSNATPNQGTAFYATALARECSADEIAHGLEVFNQRATEQGIPLFTPDRITAPARLRLYVADINEAWVLDPDADVDQRAHVF